MAFAAKIHADSISPDGVRLTSFEVTVPRIVLAEFNTHRMFSRNSASSRAIPVAKMIKRVMEDPYIPTTWGKNQKGMQAGEELPVELRELAEGEWLLARDAAVAHAERIRKAGVHKQYTNRLLEPFMWHTIIVTATELDNYWHLRDQEQAHPDIQIPTRMMREAYESHEPRKLDYGAWHLPLVSVQDYGLVSLKCKGDSEMMWRELVKISIGRCARVSYLTHEGIRDLDADVELYDRLLKSGHMSPLEHVARPATKDDLSLGRVDMEDVYTVGADALAHPKDLWFGNFRGWVQHRKEIPYEADILGSR